MNLAGRILVIDDSRMNRRQLQILLQQRGHQVILAESGEQGLSALINEPIDVILLDLVMPGMDGFEFLQRLKSSPALSMIPTIMISAQDELSGIVRAIEMGAMDYLPRPFDPVLLNARINASLAGKRLRDLEQAHLRQVQAFVYQIQQEKEKSEMLLRSILPASIVERLKTESHTIADTHEDVSVLFADMVRFTEIAARVPAAELVALLDEVFSSFDLCAQELGVEKIKTIGDAYLAAAGLPIARADHAEVMGELALGMMGEIDRLAAATRLPLQLRVGIHSGPVVAGVIGRRKQTYDLWGDTVNTASRLESHGLPGEIQVSEVVKELTQNRFHFELRGEIPLKGRGIFRTYLLKGKR